MPPIQKSDPSKPSDRPESRLSPGLRRAFATSQRAARHVLRRRFRVLTLLKDAYVKHGVQSEAMERVRDDFGTMLRMAKAWALREYSTVPWKALVYIVGAIIYFVNPIDLIPDMLAGIGFVDDAAVITAVVRAVHHELDAFRKWEETASRDLDEPEAERASLAA